MRYGTMSKMIEREFSRRLNGSELPDRGAAVRRQPSARGRTILARPGAAVRRSLARRSSWRVPGRPGPAAWPPPSAGRRFRVAVPRAEDRAAGPFLRGVDLLSDFSMIADHLAQTRSPQRSASSSPICRPRPSRRRSASWRRRSQPSTAGSPRSSPWTPTAIPSSCSAR
jgi:hypothetical protein